MLLSQVGESKIHPTDAILIARAHNEILLLPEFLNHYRRITENNISFLIVDDYSTDETNDLLSAQPDVTLYRPAKLMMYKTHANEWVTDLLNQHGCGKWCLTPDVDEHLVYRDMETKPLYFLIDEMKREKANALPAIMLDMYDNKPLADHAYRGSDLRQEFPFFDALNSYRARCSKDRRIRVAGGPRHRLFYPHPSVNSRSKYVRYVGISSTNFSRPKRDGFFYKLSISTKKRLEQLRGISLVDEPDSPNNFKTPLVLWKHGMKWQPHGISQPRSIFHRELTALLHYHFARGLAYYRQGVDRRRTIFENGPKNHLHIAITHDWSQINPACDITRTYVESHSVFDESHATEPLNTNDAYN